jgi:hypothetical protein
MYLREPLGFVHVLRLGSRGCRGLGLLLAREITLMLSLAWIGGRAAASGMRRF